MLRRVLSTVIVILLTLSQFHATAADLSAVAAPSDDWTPLRPANESGKRLRPSTLQEDYLRAISQTAQMVSDPIAQQMAAKHGLNVLNVTWEDTGRFKNSAVGPNISDMTIQVAVEDPKSKRIDTTLMPVIRFPNFSDKTADIDPRDFTLLVGNQKDKKLQRVSLYDFLKDPTAYLSNPQSWRNPNKSLLAERDSKVLVSAQAAFLPVPKKDKATFNPVIFNYQSVSGDPAVLTILATRQGTSVTVIDNKRDGFSAGNSWGQRLFHNQDGKRASLTGERFSDFSFNQDSPNKPSQGGQKKLHQGMSMVLLIQVPLKQKHPMREQGLSGLDCNNCGMGAPSAEMAKSKKADVEAAVIGHGDYEGAFTEVDNLNIERDPNFPVRVTVQFYKATSNGVVTGEDLAAIHDEIESVYTRSNSVGSLVVAGDTGRVTEYSGNKIQPADWWNEFWKRHADNTGESRDEAMRRLSALLGPKYVTRPVSDLYLRTLLKQSS